LFSPIYKNNLVVSGFSIGEITLDILLKLNIKELYLIGFDLALNQETGDTHSSSSKSGITNLNLKEIQNRDTFHTRKSLIKVKGNLKDKVFTTPFFYSSIKNAETKISKKSENISIYNLSAHGAYFEGTIPKIIEEINTKDLNDFKLINSDIINYLEKNSFTSLSEKSKKEFIEEISFLNSDIKNILNEIKDKEFNSYDEFYEKIVTLPIKLYNNKLSIFYQITVNYFQLIVPYLTYHFNDIKVKNEKKKVNKIKEIFVKQIEDILEDYIHV